MYIVRYECDNNITQAANRLGISRTWLSQVHGHWKNNHEDPRSLEPESRAPLNTANRKRIDKKVENKIIEIRKKYHPWGKDKLSVILKRDYQIIVGTSTVNRYLHKHNLVDPKLSEKNKLAWRKKKEKAELKFKMRPPSIIKDYKPGALVEKDMKFVLKMSSFTNSDKYRAKENFWYQHTLVDSFTRVRAIGLAENSDSRTVVAIQEQAASRLPFAIAAINNDNGGENEKDFSAYLEKEKVAQFFSRSGTPTDNPRVERSHLTDELEFYGLWQSNPEEAYRIKNKYSAYLKKQSRRLAKSRQMKNKEQIENLMKFIDKKLSKSNSQKCQLCSWT